jgi:plastocyanin
LPDYFTYIHPRSDHFRRPGIEQPPGNNKRVSMTTPTLRSIFTTLGAVAGAFLILFAAGYNAGAAEAVKVEISIKNHRFEPAEPTVPAGKAITLIVHNRDATPEEFESHDLKVEKVVTGKGTITLHLRPLKAGRYRFFGEYHEKTAQGALIVK